MRVIVAGEPDALLETVTDPLEVPVAAGLKLTEIVSACPTVRVTGVPAPLTPNPAPPTVMVEISTSEFPVLVMTTLCVTELPVATFPKLRLDELKESVFVAAAPVPLSGKLAGEFGALLTMETLPDADPAVAGKNWTLNVLDAPGFNDNGRLNPLVL